VVSISTIIQRLQGKADTSSKIMRSLYSHVKRSRRCYTAFCRKWRTSIICGSVCTKIQPFATMKKCCVSSRHDRITVYELTGIKGKLNTANKALDAALQLARTTQPRPVGQSLVFSRPVYSALDAGGQTTRELQKAMPRLVDSVDGGSRYSR